MIHSGCFRSGEEGVYPDLIEFTEERLKKVNPKRWDNLHGDNSNDDDVMMMMMMMIVAVVNDDRNAVSAG